MMEILKQLLLPILIKRAETALEKLARKMVKIQTKLEQRKAKLIDTDEHEEIY